MGIISSIFSKNRPRRREPRLRVRSPAIVNGVEGRLFDLTLRGFGFYASKPTLDLGKKVNATFFFSRGVKVQVRGKIVNQDDEGRVFGIMFTHVSEEDFVAIEHLLSQAEVRPSNVER